MKNLSKDECATWLKQFRASRRAGYADLHEAHKLVVEVEQFGRVLKRNGTAMLRDSAGTIRCFVRAHVPNIEEEEYFRLEGLQERIRKRRNDYAHGGSAARRLGEDVATLSICIEAALIARMMGDEPLKARDFMTSPVTIIDKGTNISTLRRMMLLNEFSRIPYRCDDGCWVWITAESLVRWLAKLEPKEKQKKFICTIGDAINDDCKLCTTPARGVPPDCELKGQEGEVLLVVSCGEAIGIITEFDWL